jgi:hypothetical protein
MKIVLFAASASLLPACTTYASEEEPAPEQLPDIEQSVVDKEFKGECDAEPAQKFVGEAADQQSGIAILKASGARTLRWGAPDTAWTMDYRTDRVSVRYDRAMKILDISCG